MDRGRKNLEMLAEEDDEEEVEGFKDTEDESETDSEDDEDSGVRRGEPNKFDGLCDGLLNAMSLVHNALKDVLDMKDELLKHALPPTVLIHLSMTTSKLYRSVSDLSMPTNELVRLVRVYSTPWEEKSAALKKLHEDYESKQRQLNIAIKRLQLVDAHSKRIAREKRVMNWEKLFAKLTSTKGHGRRWKFLIETIKQKAKMGLEHVQAYTQALEESSESEDEDVLTQAPTTRPEVGDAVSENQSEVFDEGEESRGGDNDDEDEGDEDKDEEDDDDDDESKDKDGDDTESEASGLKFANNDSDVPTVTIHLANTSDDGSDDAYSRMGSPKKVRFEEERVQVIKPPMKDEEITTETPDYDRSLFVRIYCPNGLEDKEFIRCSLTCNGQIFKTGILDSRDDEEEEAELPSASKRPRAAGNSRRTPEGSQPSKPEEPPVKKSKRFSEFELKLPDEVAEGVWRTRDMKDDPVNLQIAVHHGQYEELFAVATIDFIDIKDLPLQTIVLPTPKGNDEVLHLRSDDGSLSEDLYLDDLSDSIDLTLPDETSEHPSRMQTRDDPAKDIDALPFPLYALHATKADALHKPCATLPLVMYWGKRERPRVHNRQIGTLGVYDLVFDLTGIDLTTTTKEDLHKELVDRSASVIGFTPDAQEETVPKTEYNDLIHQHQEELQYVQDEYEKRLQELMQSLQNVQEENIALSQQQQHQILRPLSGGSPSSRISRGSSPASPGPVTFHSPVTSKVISPQTLTMQKTRSDVTGDRSQPETASSKLRPLPPRTLKPQRNFRIGRPLPKWGESLPQDFFERLHLFEEESKARKQELNERTLREIKESIEKKLAGQHKISKREEQMYDALKDVCLPALFMPTKTGNVFNPRAHQYFHPTGTTEVRLTQPPSVFQLPPLPHNNKISVVNLFELSKNFHNKGPDWLIDRYIQQQHPLSTVNYPQTPAPITSIPQQASAHPGTPPAMDHGSLESPLMDQDSHSGRMSAREAEMEA
ncbi:uncharacterized protein [Littorina saxatilis]|uniref:Uncharacterized protein n=1 Tax=Littorina saxatilis TaxID=31220 RepID=A0AAN9BPI8_9CAEN